MSSMVDSYENRQLELANDCIVAFLPTGCTMLPTFRKHNRITSNILRVIQLIQLSADSIQDISFRGLSLSKCKLRKSGITGITQQILSVLFLAVFLYDL